MTRDEWVASTDVAAMMRVARGRRSNCCGCLWVDNGDGTLSMLPGEKCCPRCDNAPFLGGWTPLATLRQLRLFAAAMCRQPEVWSRLTDPRSRRAVEVAELYALGEATEQELLTASHHANEAMVQAASPFEMELSWRCVGEINRLTENSGLPRWFSVSTKLAARQAQLLRCVCNPWPPALGEACEWCQEGWASFNRGSSGMVCPNCSGTGRTPPPWLTNSLRQTAQAVHERRGGHGILTDQLEEAMGAAATVACGGCRGFGVVEQGLEGEMLACPRCGNGNWAGTGTVPHPLLAHLRSEVHAPLGCWAVEALAGE